MRTRLLGKTGLKVSELGLGTWGLSGDGYGSVEPDQRDEVIERALALGITFFETADTYGYGVAERALGRLVPQEDKYVICTKVGTDLEGDPKRKRFDAEFLKQAVAKSQERMRRDKLDVVLLHNPSQKAMEKGEASETMQQLVDEGQIGVWGVSAGSREVARAAYSTEGPKPGVVQLAYNILYSGELKSVEHELQGLGIGIIARSVLAHGMLSGHWTRDKIFDKDDHRRERWTQLQLERRLHQMKALRGLYDKDVKTARGAALRFVLSNPRIASALIGPRDKIQLDQLVREAGTAPPYLNEVSKRNVLRRLTQMGAYR